MGLSALQRHDWQLLAACHWLIGIDEAGRGALAGPVVAGACVIRASFFESVEAMEFSCQVNDSKQLSAQARETHFKEIEAMRDADLLDFAVASGSVQEIAERNILGATRLAMQRAVEELEARTSAWALPEAASDGPLFQAGAAALSRPEPGRRTLEGERGASCQVKLIVDGRPLKPFPYTHNGIVKGDGKSLSIAIASIAAKVSRDRELVRLGADFPAYGFGGHKGYATRSHRRAILTHGASPVHRELFLRKILISNDRTPDLSSRL